jgi:beta-arrestin
MSNVGEKRHSTHPFNGTRVFKKTSLNGKITSYLGKRDFVDRVDRVDLIDGMVLVDVGNLAPGQKVFAHLVAAFRYGREDLDVLGLTFRKELLTSHVQVYPPLPIDREQRNLTRLQERLLKKLGGNAFPFWFQIPPHTAASITLQPSPNDCGKVRPCGVDYELRTYISEYQTDKPKKSGCVRLALRKLTYAPSDKCKPQPSVDVSRDNLMCPGPLYLETSLDRELYYHGESISVNIHIQNNSSKHVKKVRVAVVQTADICLFTTATYNCEVAKVESVDGFPVAPGGTLSKVLSLRPLLQQNRDKRGLALDGKLKHEDTNLASSTMLHSGVSRESMGVIVSYKVKIRLTIAGPLIPDMVAELPFTLSHPKPVEASSVLRGPARDSSEGDKPSSGLEDAEEVDLIQLDNSFREERAVDGSDSAGDNSDLRLIVPTIPPAADEDDIIFEDFARLRLRAQESIDEEATTRDTSEPPATA